MATQAEAWFRELIKDKITIKAQAHGGYLDGTMMSGDEQAGQYKFPIIGSLESVELSGAIEMVDAANAEMSTVSMTPKDYEASTWFRTQDIYKMGPSHQDALAKLITMAIRRRKDKIKWDALYSFTSAVTQDIGGTGVLIDPRYLEQARSEIAAEGMVEDEGMVFCPLPERAFAQLIQYKEFADARYTGPENAAWSMERRKRTKTVRDVNYFPMPDANFTFDAENYFETFMWSNLAIGAETPWDQQAPSITQHTDRAGSPWLIKAGVGGCAVGIQRVGVKKLRFKANKLPERVPILTEAAA